MLTFNNFLVVALGGLVGSVLRWWVSVALNPLVAAVPLGTLTVNIVGGFIIGMALAYFIAQPATPVALRLLVTSGFCGGFTTFSAFSAEVVGFMVEGRLAFALATIGANLAGALLATFLGMKTVQSLA
ncbi:MAG: camphor resistance protein CrcB [Betaproteobacteria bacterium]|nr:camphor resistance protein CrcB [Betaproteobacteria bacterium]